MKTLTFILTVFIMTNLYGQKSIYDFSIKTIDGVPYDLSQLKGKKIMMVNVASKCGFTPQYEKLEMLYERYKDKNFVVIGFPANNFLNQEPGTAEEIKNFCTTKYNVSFPIMEKISVKGKDIHPLYQWLTDKTKNGVSNEPIKWNFQKFLIDENGQIALVIPPNESPMSEKIIQWIENK
ncbi:MAG: glutathione peroxidase [Bacteroidales bacterium]|jgi:glutathione peroxidase|nr:glutathione peroxidase [Bacteroidales bacterium]